MIIYKEISNYRKNLDIITNYFHYPIAIFLCSLVARTSVTPNILTFLAIVVELVAVSLILLDITAYSILIVILLQFGWIFDLMDGMLARYKKTGFYDQLNPSLKGYYFDAVSDHCLKFLILGALIYQYSLQEENGWIIGLIVIIIHGIAQTEHTLRKMILKTKIKKDNATNNSMTIFDEIALLMNNIYIFYFIFILINRIDLLLISFALCQLILFIKRVIKFSLLEA